MERSPGMVTGVDNGLGPKTIPNISIMQEKQIGGIPEKVFPHSYPTLAHREGGGSHLSRR